MNVNPPRIQFARLLSASALAVAMAVGSGCDDSEGVRTYDAPKEAAPATQVADASAAAGAGAKKAAEAPIEWKVPAGWKQQPAQQMRYASFQVSEQHPDVVLTVIPLPREANPLLANVNRWEEQVGLPKTPEADLAKVVTHVDIPPDAYADIVDLVGKDPKSGEPRRMLAAIVPHDDQAWFFKLLGPADVVAPQKANFDAFIRSIQFHGHEGHDHKHDGHDHGHDHGPAKAQNLKLAWGALPAGWAEDKAEKPFRLHTIKVEQGGEAADLAVTRMTIEQAGGLMDNINRWRQSVGLEPTTDPAAHQAKNATIGGQPGFRIDVKGAEKSVIVGMTSAGNQLWFFKLTGPNKLVEAQSGEFDKFLSSVRFAAGE